LTATGWSGSERRAQSSVSLSVLLALVMGVTDTIIYTIRIYFDTWRVFNKFFILFPAMLFNLTVA
jgi:hypothetical protein